MQTHLRADLTDHAPQFNVLRAALFDKRWLSYRKRESGGPTKHVTSRKNGQMASTALARSLGFHGCVRCKRLEVRIFCRRRWTPVKPPSFRLVRLDAKVRQPTCAHLRNPQRLLDKAAPSSRPEERSRKTAYKSIMHVWHFIKVCPTKQKKGKCFNHSSKIITFC